MSLCKKKIMEKFKIFDTLSKRFVFPGDENNNKKFHYEIEKDKKSILNYYKIEPLYKDKIDKMEMKSRGIFYYKNLVKNQIKKRSNFVKIILKSISEINERPKKTVEINLKKGFNTPEIELIQKRKNKIDLRFIKRNREVKNKYNYNSFDNSRNSIFLLSGKKCLELDDNNKSNDYSKKGLINRNRIFSGIKGDSESNESIKKSISRSLSSNLFLTKNYENDLINNERRINKFNSLLNKCQKEIKSGDKIGENVEVFTERFNKYLSLAKSKRDNKVDNNLQDQAIVEDKIKPKQKYKLLEIEKFNELKRKILNEKLSDNYICSNRKKFSEIANDKTKNDEYDLYYEDINKINEKILENRLKEKDKFEKIQNLLEYSYKKKNYLKNKIMNYKHNRITQLEKETKDKFNFDIFIKEKKNKKENNGNLVPKLLLKRKETKINDKKLFEI